MSTSGEEGGGSGSKILLIVLGIVGGMFLLCGGAVVISIAAISLLGRSAQNTFNSVGNTINTASASTGMPPTVTTDASEAAAREFLGKLKSTGVGPTYQGHTTRSFRQRQTEAQLQTLVEQNSTLRNWSRVDLHPLVGTPTVATFKAEVHGMDKGFVPATIDLRMEDGAWKVDRFSVP